VIPAPSRTLCDADTGPSPAEQTIGLRRPPHRRHVLPHLGPPLRAPHAARLGLVRVSIRAFLAPHPAPAPPRVGGGGARIPHPRSREKTAEGRVVEVTRPHKFPRAVGNGGAPYEDEDQGWRVAEGAEEGNILAGVEGAVGVDVAGAAD